MKEIWKDIRGYEGYYQISNLGNLKSLDRKIIRKDKREVVLKGKNIKYRIGKIKGGVQVGLTKNGIQEKYSLPRLVYSTFNPDFDINNMDNLIFFKDGDQTNSSLDNLYCDTRDSVLLKKTNQTKKRIRCITTGKEFEAIRQAERYYNTKGNINLCLNGERKSAGKLEDGTKLMWEYID